MAYYTNNQSATDRYTDVGAISLGPFDALDTINILVAGNPAAIEFYLRNRDADQPDGNYTLDDTHEFIAAAGPGSINSVKVGNIRGLRVRNSNAGQVAVVSLSGYRTGAYDGSDSTDPIFEAGSLYSGTLSATGVITTSTGVLIPVVALANFPPANPQDGQEVLLELPSSYDPVGGKAVRWHCAYNIGTGMWDVTGSSLYAEVQTNESVAAGGGYADLATVGPSVTLPRGGDYDIGIGFLGNAWGTVMAYSIGGGGASDADSVQSGQGGPPESVGRPRRKSGLTGGNSVVAKYKTLAGPGQFASRWMSIVPVRIS